MDKTTISFTLPESLANQAEKAGLLTNDALIRWIEKELERRARIDEFFEAIDKISSIEPRPTPEEIDAEIAAYRSDFFAAGAASTPINNEGSGAIPCSANAPAYSG
jgi:hypothetical protein